MRSINMILDLISYDAHRIKTDSREVSPGDIFIAIKGGNFDGHMFVEEALSNGAIAVLCERMPAGLQDEKSKIIIVDDSREMNGIIAGMIFRKISSGMKFYGVTGTNGKTTTAFLMHAICKHSGDDCGLLSTVHNIVKGDNKEPSKMTTQDSSDINRFISDMSRNGKNVSVVEISSHALAQGRVSGLDLDAAVFTNITPEHLDYHKDMDAYLRDKLKIFERVNSDGVGVINSDDKMLSEAIPEIKVSRLVTFGVNSDSDVMARDVRLSPRQCEFVMDTKDFGEIGIKAGFIGLYNVYNVLAASSALLYSGYTLKNIRDGLENASDVPGRLDKITSKAPFDVFVDYAHTPDALNNVLECLKALKSGRLLCLFGCGGDRDNKKRPLMGKIASDMCDFTVITDDNPRGENPEEIIKQVEKGMIGRSNYCIIQPREKAISGIINKARAGDIVLIAGKGHENYQIIGEQVFHFDDKEIAGKILNSLGH